jgi:hypothetical protein
MWGLVGRLGPSVVACEYQRQCFGEFALVHSGEGRSSSPWYKCRFHAHAIDSFTDRADGAGWKF